MTAHIPSPAPPPGTHRSHPVPATSVPLQPRGPHLRPTQSCPHGAARKGGEAAQTSAGWPPGASHDAPSKSRSPGPGPRHPAGPSRQLSDPHASCSGHTAPPCPGTHLMSPAGPSISNGNPRGLSLALPRPYPPPPTAVTVVRVFMSSKVPRPHQSVRAQGPAAFALLTSVFPASVAYSTSFTAGGR